MNDAADDTATTPVPPPVVLDAIQARVLGSLVEKHATTPDVYPLTLNAVVAACNQKSNREPTTDFETGEVGHALRELEGKGLVTGSLTARASRYAQRFDAVYGTTPRQRALLAVLLLRGPQTANELYTRCERLGDFPDVAEVRTVLERLASREPALAVCIGRGAGQREERYMHLLCGPVSAAELAARTSDEPASEPRSGLGERVARLEAIVEALQAELAALRARLPSDGDDAA